MQVDQDYKLEIVFQPHEKDYFYCLLAWSDNPSYHSVEVLNESGEFIEYKDEVLPGTENGTWYNTGICGREDTPEEAFRVCMERFREKINA